MDKTLLLLNSLAISLPQSQKPLSPMRGAPPFQPLRS